MFLQAVRKVLKSSKFTYISRYQRNESVKSNGMTSCYQMDMQGQTGVCVVGGTGMLGEGELLKEAVALLDPALSQDEGRNYQEPLAANLHLSLLLWITPIKTNPL